MLKFGRAGLCLHRHELAFLNSPDAIRTEFLKRFGPFPLAVTFTEHNITIKLHVRAVVSAVATKLGVDFIRKKDSPAGCPAGVLSV
jgi:hypothetical protein